MISSRNIGRVIFLVSFFIFSALNTIRAQYSKVYEDSIMINYFFNNLYNFYFHKADSLIVVMNKANMDKATVSNIKANLAWWKILSGEEINNNLRICNSNINESIRSAENREDINSLLNIIYSYSLKARLENYKGNSLKSFVYFYKSIGFIEKYKFNSVNNEKLYLVLGLYYYSIYYVKNEHFILSTLFFPFPDVNKTTALNYLKDCSSSNNEMIRTEANYFLLKIYAYTEKDYLNAYKTAQILTRQYPDNLVYSLEQLKLLIVLKKSNEAKILKDKLLREIQIADYLNNAQKNHFLLQIQEITKSGI